MMRRLKHISILVLFPAGILLVLGWILLSSTLFRDLRTTVVSDALSDLLGQLVTIDGDVHLSFSPDLAVVATGLRLPAEGFPDLDLAKLDLVRFPILFGTRLRSGIALPEIEARGLTVTLLQSENGSRTWVTGKAEKPTEPDTQNDPQSIDLVAFLGKRDVSFTDMRLRSENRLTGFEFEFELNRFKIEQGPSNEGAAVKVRSDGRINEQPFAFSGDFPTGAAFDAEGNLGDLRFTMEGERPPGQSFGDFEGRLKIETMNTQNLLDVLRLEGEVAARAKAELRLVRRDTRLNMEDIDLQMRLETGETAQLTGRFADARFGSDFDLTLFVDFIGENPTPPPAIFIKDIRLKSGEIRVLASDGNIEIDRFTLQTNAFEEEVRDIGPFRVASVVRSPEGKVKLDGVTLVLGPQDMPYLIAEGSLDSLLTFEGYRLDGTLNLPAQRVLLPLKPEQAARFGRLVGELKLRETNGKPDLQKFELRSRDTDLWSADLSMKNADNADPENLDALELRAEISAPDGSELLEAMRLEPVDIGFMGYEIRATRVENSISADATLSAGETAIKTQISLGVPGNRPELRGTIQSNEVQVKDVRNMVLALVQMARIRSVYADAKLSSESSDINGFQPLVLPDPEQNDPKTEQAQNDLSEFQPLVLPDAEPIPDTDHDLSDFQPLVLTDSAASLALEDVLNPEQLVRHMDAEVDIDIERIIGQAGVSHLKSQLRMKEGNVRLGPVNLAYGKGFAQVSATIDAIGAPDKLRITGETGGWDFGEILVALGVDIGAYGTLTGQFDLTGHWPSAKAFANSMQGNVMIDMRNGRVSSGLIELAGLGVLPWLFSKERRQGYANIVCLKAPLEIGNGRITTRETVLETERVQLVGSGIIDVGNNSISVVAEPRPVGQPLSRSAWPIEISGSLTSPDIKIAERKTRRALVPLSITGTRALCVPDISQLE